MDNIAQSMKRTINLKLGENVYTEMLKSKSIQQSMLGKKVTWDDFCMTLLELFQDSIRGVRLDIEYPKKRVPEKGS
jgi:hypothetical protein